MRIPLAALAALSLSRPTPVINGRMALDAIV